MIFQNDIASNESVEIEKVSHVRVEREGTEIGRHREGQGGKMMTKRKMGEGQSLIATVEAIVTKEKGSFRQSFDHRDEQRKVQMDHQAKRGWKSGETCNNSPSSFLTTWSEEGSEMVTTGRGSTLVVRDAALLDALEVGRDAKPISRPQVSMRKILTVRRSPGWDLSRKRCDGGHVEWCFVVRISLQSDVSGGKDDRSEVTEIATVQTLQVFLVGPGLLRVGTKMTRQAVGLKDGKTGQEWCDGVG